MSVINLINLYVRFEHCTMILHSFVYHMCDNCGYGTRMRCIRFSSENGCDTILPPAVFLSFCIQPQNIFRQTRVLTATDFFSHCSTLTNLEKYHAIKQEYRFFLENSSDV
jgi:hypothetical protein